MKRRLISLTLVCALLLPLLPTSIFAQSVYSSGVDVSAEFIPEAYRDRFALLTTPEPDGSGATTARWLGDQLIYFERGNGMYNGFGLLRHDGKIQTQLIFDGAVQAGEDHILHLADGSGWMLLNNDTGELTEMDADPDCTWTTYGWPQVAFLVAGTDTDISIFNAQGKMLMAPTMNVSVKDYIGEGVLHVLNHNTGLSALFNDRNRTDFVYSRIGLNTKPFVSNHRVYAERDGVGGFVNTETLDEIAFRYDTGSLITQTGLISQDFRGDVALILRSDGAGDTWHVLLDSNGKEIGSLAELETQISTYPSANIQYTSLAANLGLVSLPNGADSWLISVSAEGYTSKKLEGLRPVHFVLLPDFSLGVFGAIDTKTNEYCLVDRTGAVALRGFAAVEDVGTTDGVTWISLTNEDGLYGLYTVGGGFTGYCFSDLYDLHATVTQEDGSTYEVALSPNGLSLFLDTPADIAYAQYDEGYGYARWEDGYYFCNLSDLTTHGPYECVIFCGQERIIVQEDPTVMVDFSGNIVYSGAALYAGHFSQGFAPYCLSSSDEYHGLMDCSGNLYDFGWAYSPEVRSDDGYGIFHDDTAIIEISGHSYLLRLQPGAEVTPDPQLLYTSPVAGAGGLPLFDTITLAFDRPVTLPGDGQIQLLCADTLDEIPVSVDYGNPDETVLRLSILEPLALDTQYYVFVADNAIWPQNGEEKRPFTGLSHSGEFSFRTGSDAIVLSDLDLIRYFPTYLQNSTCSQLESAMQQAYSDVMHHFSAFDTFSMSYFYTLKDPANSLFGYAPGISQMRYRELLQNAVHRFLYEAAACQILPNEVQLMATGMDAIDWRQDLSQDADFRAFLSQWMSASQATAFQKAVGKLQTHLDALELTAETSQLVCAIIVSELTDRQLAYALRDALPNQSQLEEGLDLALNTVYTDTFLITKYCTDEVLEYVCDYAQSVLFSEIGHISGGALAFANLSLDFLCCLHDVMGLVTAESLNELITYHGFVNILHAAVLSQQADLAKAGTACTQEQVNAYQQIYTMYLLSLRMTLELSADMATNTQMADGGTLRITAQRYADILQRGDYCYNVYMQNCKRAALNNASQEYLYQVALDRRTATLGGSKPTSRAFSAKSTSDTLYLPTHIDGYPVTTIGAGIFADNEQIKTLVIPDTVTAIEADAFAGCTSLEQVILGCKLETIGQGAFAGCTALTSIALPETLRKVDALAFSDTALRSVIVSGHSLEAAQDAFPEGIVFFGDSDSAAEALAESCFGTFIAQRPRVQQLELLQEPQRSLYVPYEQIDPTGLLLSAEGQEVNDNWIICCDLSQPGEQIVTVHYCGAKIEFTVTVGEDSFYFEDSCTLLLPDWLYGTLLVAAYDKDGRLLETKLVEDACGTVYNFDWAGSPASVRAFLLSEDMTPEVDAAAYPW